jgi:monovalent cation:H+ antiporter-2, CPA2 family
MVCVIPDITATLQIVTMARAQNPTLEIIARTRYVTEAGPLYRAGVKTVVVEEFETSLEIVEQILRCYQVPEAELQKRKESTQREFIERS